MWGLTLEKFIAYCKAQKRKSNQELFIQESFKIAKLLSRMFEIDYSHDHGYSNDEWLKCYNELKDMWKNETNRTKRDP